MIYSAHCTLDGIFNDEFSSQLEGTLTKYSSQLKRHHLGASVMRKLRVKINNKEIIFTESNIK